MVNGKASMSTTALSVLIIVLILLPVPLAGIVDDVRLGGGIAAEPTLISIVDFEDGEAIASSQWFDPLSPQSTETTPLGTLDNTSISGDSLAATMDLLGFDHTISPIETMFFAVALNRQAFIDSEPASFRVTWVRDDTPSTPQTVAAAWFSCPSVDLGDCIINGAPQDFHQFINDFGPFALTGDQTIEILVEDLVGVNGVSAVPTGGFEFLVVAFTDVNIAEGTIVVMDAQVRGIQAPVVLSLDFFGLLLGAYSIFILIPAAVFMLDSVTVQSVSRSVGLGRRGRRPF